jgi:hypothetical protein
MKKKKKKRKKKKKKRKKKKKKNKLYNLDIKKLLKIIKLNY